MKVYSTQELRNLGIVGHGDAGKTSLVAAMLFATGATTRLGRVDDGTAPTDYDEEEIARKISLNITSAYVEHKGSKINLIDTPGYAAFIAHARPALRVCETAVFVVQDDPQAGFDHIDGHRTVAMVISPYTPRGKVDSTNYNQTSMIRTMELILGLPPMNQLDASASAMTGCFTEEANLAPYEAVKNNIPLDRLNPEVTSIRDERQRHWATVSLRLPRRRKNRASRSIS